MNLNPPPHSSVQDLNSPAWQRWFSDLMKKVTATGAILWTQIDKTGSNLTDLVTRNHNDLQSLQGGTAAQYYHLTNIEHNTAVSLNGLTYTATAFVKLTGINTFSLDTTTYLSSLSGAVLISQATPQTIGDTTNRLAKLWATDITVTNTITGSVSGNAGTATNGEVTTNKDATGGYAGLTLFKINFKNAANTFTSFFTNTNTASHSYTFPDKDITVAGLVDITGTNSGTNTGDETAARIATINHGALVKTTLVDADEVTGQDSAATFGLIRTTWTNVKAFLKTYFDGVYAAIAQVHYVGTTSIAANRASAAQSLTGITSIDGSAASLTTIRSIYGNNFDGTSPVIGALTFGESQTVLASTKFATGSAGRNLFLGGGGQSTTYTSSDTGSYNTAIGVYSLYSNTTGYYNAAIGYAALYNNTTGYYNTAIGCVALYNNTTGYDNTAIGYAALRYNTTGYDNAAIGYAALYNNTTGYYNTAIGLYSLYNNTTGNSNTAIGLYSLVANTTGSSNTAIGYNAGSDINPAIAATANVNGTIYRISSLGNTNFTLFGAASNTLGLQFTSTATAGIGTGTMGRVADNNIAIGYNTGRGIISGNGNTIIGSNVTGLAATLTNNIIFASGSGSIKAQHDGINWSLTGGLRLPAGTATASTAPLKLTSGTLNTTAEAGAIEFLTDRLYATVTTNAIRKQIITSTSGRVTAQTAANASIATYTLGAADASFEVSANVLVTTSGAEAFTLTCTYTDEGNTARTLTMPFILLAGTTAAAIGFANGAVPYEGLPTHIRCKASTTITIATTGTFTGATYNAEAVIKQTA